MSLSPETSTKLFPGAHRPLLLGHVSGPGSPAGLPGLLPVMGGRLGPLGDPEWLPRTQHTSLSSRALWHLRGADSFCSLGGQGEASAWGMGETPPPGTQR